MSKSKAKKTSRASKPPKSVAAEDQPRPSQAAKADEGKAGQGAKRREGRRLLSGGNPQIAKAEGDAPVQAYIAAMPAGSATWGSARRTSSAACPWQGREVELAILRHRGQGWFLSFQSSRLCTPWNVEPMKPRQLPRSRFQPGIAAMYACTGDRPRLSRFADCRLRRMTFSPLDDLAGFALPSALADGLDLDFGGLCRAATDLRGLLARDVFFAFDFSLAFTFCRLSKVLGNRGLH